MASRPANGLSVEPRPLVPLASATTWGVVRQELLTLAYALQEIALLTPFALIILGWARYWPPGLVVLWFLLLMLLPFNLSRLMSLLQWERGRQRWGMFIALLLTTLLSWRLLLYAPRPALDLSWLGQFGANLAEAGNLLWMRDLSIFLLTVVVFWRGIRLVSRGPDINRIGLRLRVGGLLILPFVVWFANSFLDFSAVPFILLFFLASLTAVALVRAEQLEQDQTGQSSNLDWRWFLAVFATALVVTLAGALIATFISGDSLFEALSWFSPLWRALQFGGTVVLLTLYTAFEPLLNVLAVIIGFLGQVLAWLFGAMSAGLSQITSRDPLAPPTLPAPTGTPTIALPPTADKAIVTVMMIGLLLLVALALAGLYRQAGSAARRSQRSERIETEEDASPGIGERLLDRLGLFRGRRAAASIRRIYQQMCRAAGSAGYPRLEAETPYEYLRTLRLVWPEGTADSRLITEAYVRVRYGELPETRTELDAIRDAWRRLEAIAPQEKLAERTGEPTLVKRE